MTPASPHSGPLAHLLAFSREHWRRLLLLFFGLLVPLLIFVSIAEDVFNKEPFAFEKPLMLALHAGASPMLDRVAVAFSLLGSARGMVPVTLVLAYVFYRLRHRLGYFLALSLGGVALINVLLKNVFERPRPAFWTPILPEPDSSFPSGHAMFASALATSLAVLLWPTRWRVPALVLGGLYVLGMMWSRVYIGVHYPTDVLGGALFSLAWVIALTRALRIHPAFPVQSREG
ncbi:phosphatase PAP2 family protein [Deinococcus sp. MIMF12]|uniref:Phosphatase PAP2 family protein n=1 Tax=Deinococcus rhizophilus TaxID=3049544 RepID=A0ABT7JK16_9DEIO|nr:phosphatase PAP2 family protein [Deinococcus rhizophilus]MDL2345400.1 phosphatase PAP2 family protein [Deinococcus rhizophilus]